MNFLLRMRVAFVACVFAACIPGCITNGELAELVQDVRAWARGDPKDCFTTDFAFAECCCAPDTGDLKCWQVEQWITYQRCCGHNENECCLQGVECEQGYGQEAFKMLQDLSLTAAKNHQDEEYERSCWSSAWQLKRPDFPWPRERCCDTSLSSVGERMCWNEEFTFERCCSRLWMSKRQQGCTSEILLDVEVESDISGNRTYQALWRNDGFHALYRIVRQILNSRDSDRPNVKDAPCLLAFLASRMISFTKLSWDYQWNLLTANELDHGPTSMREASLALQLLGVIKFDHLVAAAPKWALVLFKYLISHTRKLRNYLDPDVLPVLGASFLPSDPSMSTKEWAFCQELLQHLHRGSSPSSRRIKEFLDGGSIHPQETYLVRQSRHFSVAVGNVALAYAYLQEGSRDKLLILRQLRIASESYRLFLEPLPQYGGFAHIFFTAWPLWKLLHKITLSFLELESDRNTKNNLDVSRSASIGGGRIALIVYCGKLPIQIQPFSGPFELKTFAGPDCRNELMDILWQESRKRDWIAILSPFLLHWDPSQSQNLLWAAQFLLEHNASIAGFPVADGRNWRWPVYRIRHAFWRLRYEPYPTGHRLAIGSCVGGDSTSATRIYRASFLRKLLASIGPDTDDTNGATLIMELDLLAMKKDVPAYTCMHPPFIVNGTYLHQAKLTPAFSNKYAIEHAELGLVTPSENIETLTFPSQNINYNRHEYCKPSVFGNENYEVLASGKIPHWCYRRSLQILFRTVVAWWSHLDAERHVVLPMQGTLLTALARGGEFGAMPWDKDFEMILSSTGSNAIVDTCRQRTITTWEELDGCVGDQLRDALSKYIPNVHLASTVSTHPSSDDNIRVSRLLFEKDKVFAKLRYMVGYQPWNASLLDVVLHEFIDLDDLFIVRPLGVKMYFSWFQWEHQMFEIYGGDLRKKVGTSGTIDKNVSCEVGSEHNACLRDTCDIHSNGCTFELPDWFAHADLESSAYWT